MLTIKESSRPEPTKAICSECNQEISFAIHHDYLEGFCCGKEYHIKINNGAWNCCNFPDNPSIHILKDIQEGKFDPYNTYKK